MPPGELVGPLEVGPIAHGGHCVARHEGRVIFVRHALPGERVRVRLTDTGHDRFWRADAIEILTPSEDRTEPRCPIAGPGLCGGCDFQHVDLAAQRRLKAAVVREHLQHLAGLSWGGDVEPVATPETADGLHWRTRMRYPTDPEGHPGLYAHRSTAIVRLPPIGCPIADPRTPQVADRVWPANVDLVAVAGAEDATLLVDGNPVAGSAVVIERAAGRAWSVAADGFWQVHPGAADTLVGAVLAGLEPRPGERALDLYCGVGLFAGALADAGCRVWAVEASRRAIELARANLADVGGRVRFAHGRVDRRLERLPSGAELVVLDPPRTGAGRAVIDGITRRRPRAIAYVACDPAALARDLGRAAERGYGVTQLRAFDLFPMTHHVECVAVLAPTGRGTG